MASDDHRSRALRWLQGNAGAFSDFEVLEDRERPRYQSLRNIVEQMRESVPGKLEITRDAVVHDMVAPWGPHELTAARVSRRLEKVMPDGLLAHTGTPDVEDPNTGVLRHPDVILIAEADMEVEGSLDPRALIAAIEVVSRSNPDNDWVGKMRDYPLLGIPVYVIFDPRAGEGTVLSDIHSTPSGPRYATRKDFVYGEDVTIGDWTISTENLPRYP
ncbi:Uma2 family endonuclease [Streptomyces sp. NBS 14/10]|uniref:Uma2 family endonuclease n=1 Tax=Streptomyces sp. NBS 14/10 TaxID=1945643 RepID=UPI00211B3616|nr:Uma2 family endonuclease [Streptomyces sp. NBS 14/10]KAK1180016.1 Uma2 family endonuclease [Streptomyces sp. NBS 14/10]